MDFKLYIFTVFFLVTDAVRNVDCKKGQTDVTIETGEDFEGVISVQKADGRPDSRCLIRGSGTSQRTYILPINHSICAMEFLEVHVSLVTKTEWHEFIWRLHDYPDISINTSWPKLTKYTQVDLFLTRNKFYYP